MTVTDAFKWTHAPPYHFFAKTGWRSAIFGEDRR
jgi:hypothetical protein